jgi:hypothetical protein
VRFPTSRLARTTAAIILSIGLACVALAQTVSPGGPDILKSSPTNTSEPRPTANGEPLPNSDEVGGKQRQYLEQRYELSGRTHPTARLGQGVTGEAPGQLSPADIRQRNLFPYAPLLHPSQEVGGMVFPPVQTKVRQGLERVDVPFDLPDACPPEFPRPSSSPPGLTWGM